MRYSVSSRYVLPLLLVSLAACDNTQEPTAPGVALSPAGAAVAAPSAWLQASPGQAHTCGLGTDSLAWCWGWGELGQLGTGASVITEPSPVAVQGTRRWRDIQSGDAHTCGLTRARRVFCWGDNHLGQLGDGTTSNNQVNPTAVATSLAFVQISAGSAHTCGVTAAGAAYCWGDNPYGQLGDGSRTRRLAPVKVTGNLVFRHVRAGWDHTCGVTTADVAYCWGRNKVGQVGDGTVLTRGRPTRVAGGLKFRLIRTGQRHTCALTPSGNAYCWGLNDLGQAGDGTSLNERHSPVAVVNGANFESLALGSAFSCGVRENASAWCWGFNANGLGDGTSTFSDTPVGVTGGLLWHRLNAGATSHHACGITTAGSAYCWGDNFRGQIGDGTHDDRSVPTAVEGG
jgi:alpha-tubulin suppressor-like RCC1 family protein